MDRENENEKLRNIDFPNIFVDCADIKTRESCICVAKNILYFKASVIFLGKVPPRSFA